MNNRAEIHTPGPWKVSEYVPTRVDSCIRKDSGNISEQICRMSSGSKEARANARLIATAPELLTEIKIAREYIRSLHGSLTNAMGHDKTTVKPDLDRINALIAKADGCKPSEINYTVNPSGQAPIGWHVCKP